jgi:hypothetical protein
MLTWDTCRDIFEWQGGFVDFYVFETERSDWQRLLKALPASPARLQFRHGHTESPLPQEVGHVFGYWEQEEPEVDIPVLDIYWRGLRIVTDFWDEREMEFGIDPREIHGEPEFRDLVAFFHIVADNVGKPVVLPRYGEPDRPIIRIGPGEHEAAFLADKHGGAAEGLSIPPCHPERREGPTECPEPDSP